MKSRRGGKLRAQRTGLRFEDVFTFSVQVGNTTTVQKSTLSSLPPSCNFRPSRWVVESLQAFVPGTTSLPGYYCPAAIQCRILEGTASSETSVLKLCASSITRVTMVPRPDYPWFDAGVANSTGLFSIDAVCVGPPANNVNSYLRGVVRVMVELQPETSATACPALLQG